MSDTINRNIGIPVISLPEKAELAAIELAAELPAGAPHLEACQLAMEQAAQIVPVVQEALTPVTDNDSFAYLVDTSSTFDWLEPEHFENVMRIRTLAVASALGEISPDPIETKDGGDLPLLAQVTPLPGREEDQCLNGSVDLLLHIENQPAPPADEVSVHDTKTDFVVLGTVHNKSGTVSYVAPVRRVLDVMSDQHPEALEGLQRAAFRLKAMDGNKNEQGVRIPEPILRADGSVYFDFADVLPVDQEAAEAYKVFESLIHSLKLGFVATGGQIQVIDNHESPHGRGPTGPRLALSGHVKPRFSARRSV